MNNVLRPMMWLEEYGRRFPGVWKALEGVHATLPEGAPQWAYLPAKAAISYAVTRSKQPTVQAIVDGSALHALAAWRMTKGIYRYDPTTFEMIYDTPLDGIVPIDVLYELPEWCVYIETKRDGEPILIEREGRPDMALHGFFAQLTPAALRGHNSLNLTLDCDLDGARNLIPSPYVLRRDTIQGSMLGMFDDLPDVRAKLTHSDIEAEAEQGSRLISLLLYLCSANVDLRDAKARQVRPSNPVKTRIKGGERLFPLPAPTVWETGYRIGVALRGALAEIEKREGTPHAHHAGGPKRPHVRRAHWHTFLTGPRDKPRIPRLDWMPPIPVNVGDFSELEPVLHPVK